MPLQNPYPSVREQILVKTFYTLALLTLPALVLLAGCGGGNGGNSNPGSIGSRVARIQELGTLPNGPASTPNVYATAINNNGQVVGYTDGLISHAFVWQNGKMTDLGTLSGGNTSSQATAINDQGVIVGTAQQPGPLDDHEVTIYDYNQACRFAIGSSPQPLPVGTGGIANLPQGNSAVGVNNAGQIAGTAVLDDPGLQLTTNIAYIFANGKLLAADFTPDGYAGSDAAGINNQGQVCGTLEPFSFAGGGGGTMTNAGTQAGSATMSKAAGRFNVGNAQRLPYNRFAPVSGAAVRTRGTAIGRADAPAFVDPHAFVYSKGAFTDLGTLAGMSSYATAINDAGYVVGKSNVTTDGFHAFVWRSGTMSDIGTLGGPASHANAIAPNGDVVGAADTSVVGNVFTLGSSITTTYVSHAFIWRNGKMTDLNTLLPANSGWMLQEATGINSKGQIVGFGTYTTMGTRSFLLTL